MSPIKKRAAGRPLRLYNSLGRLLEEFQPLDPYEVTLYTCGPTLYHYVHIGNFRTFVFEDLLRRSLKWFGYRVKQVMNLTDVDDKTIRGALREGITLKEYTKKYGESFFEDIEALGIERAEYYPCATDYIEEMLAMIGQLLEKRFAYQAEDKSIYFSVSRYADYGQLAQLAREQVDQGSLRGLLVDCDEYEKEALADFVLWKSYDPERDGSVYWPSPWGAGRPGWHIECSAMARALLGEKIDIHTGGVDNLFPHHENERAQSQCCHEKPLARYWLHSDHLLVEGKKMSKSSGNFYTLRDLIEKGHDPLSIRYLLLQTHYRHSLNFTLEGLSAAARSVERLQSFRDRLQKTEASEGVADQEPITEKMLFCFEAALAEDLNISAALGILFDWLHQINRLLDEQGLSCSDLEAAREALQRLDTILGVIYKAGREVPESVLAWVERRQAARKAQEWEVSDQLRDWIFQAGYWIEDRADGTTRLKAAR